MKHFNLALAVAFIFSFASLNAQNDQDDYKDYGSDSKFSLITYGGVGYAVIENNDQPNYNLNAKRRWRRLCPRGLNRW